VDEATRNVTLRDVVGHFVKNAATAVEATLGLVHRAWKRRPVARADATECEN